jgi:uracil-DNA glycosylase family 4
MKLPRALTVLNDEVIACRRCKRLVAWREKVARDKKRAYMDLEYWGKPVPGFGDPNARVFILGLAPGAHGSNRTGRVFTGDSSGNFMYPVLHRTGFASQPRGTHRGDGMVLTDAYITAAARCAPPQNKPTPRELANCAPFLDRELALLKNVHVVVALGRIGFEAYLNHLKRIGVIESKKAYAFGHGVEYEMPDGRILVGSYHPSNQNTNTGKLTAKMFTKLFERVAHLAGCMGTQRAAR